MAEKKQKPPAAPRCSAGEKKVEAALLRRALGFTQEEVYSEDLVDKKSGEVVDQLKRKVVRKEVPPDVRALLFWLKNRLPERWNERNINNPDPTETEYDFNETEQNL